MAPLDLVTGGVLSDVFKQRKRVYSQYCRNELANGKAAEKARKAMEKADK
jgi:hypothetical protein